MIIVHGSSASTYGRTVQMTLREKGLQDFTVVENAVHTPEQDAVHPWGKVPAFSDDEVHLFETLAITHYIDEAYDGPDLRPSELAGRSAVLQWMSAICDNLTSAAFPIIIERLIVPTTGGEPDEEKIAACVAPLTQTLGVFAAELGKQPYLVGKSLSLADLLLLPIIDYLRMTPEGEKAMNDLNSLPAWHDKMMARPSAQAVLRN